MIMAAREAISSLGSDGSIMFWVGGTSVSFLLYQSSPRNDDLRKPS